MASRELPDVFRQLAGLLVRMRSPWLRALATNYRDVLPLPAAAIRDRGDAMQSLNSVSPNKSAHRCLMQGKGGTPCCITLSVSIAGYRSGLVHRWAAIASQIALILSSSRHPVVFTGHGRGPASSFAVHPTRRFGGIPRGWPPTALVRGLAPNCRRGVRCSPSLP